MMPSARPEVPEALENLRNSRPWFDSRVNSEPPLRFVAWVDLMGARNIMSRSMPITANFIGKLHAMAVCALPENNSSGTTRLYPVVDGLHVTTSNKSDMVGYLRWLFAAAALCFVLEEDPLFHFMLRAGIGHGPLWEGRELTPQFDRRLSQDKRHAESILLGPPVIDAFEAEKKASPFGIWVDESARVYPSQDGRLPFTHLRWWKQAGPAIPENLTQTLAIHLKWYFDWCAAHTFELMYAPERIKVHLGLAREYFEDDWPPES